MFYFHPILPAVEMSSETFFCAFFNGVRKTSHNFPTNWFPTRSHSLPLILFFFPRMLSFPSFHPSFSLLSHLLKKTKQQRRRFSCLRPRGIFRYFYFFILGFLSAGCEYLCVVNSPLTGLFALSAFCFITAPATRKFLFKVQKNCRSYRGPSNNPARPPPPSPHPLSIPVGRRYSLGLDVV